MKNYTIRTEQPRDFKIVENLTREAFWNVYRPGCTEHYVLHRYRSEPDFVPELSLVLEVDGEIIGHVMYAWSHIDADDGRKIRMMTFGPISICPGYQCKGFGTKLLNHSMEIAKKMGAGCLLIRGDIKFFGKCGFIPAIERGIRYAKDPEATDLLCKELQEGFLDGITGSYRDPEPYFVAMRTPEAFEKYDAEFPQKEKLVPPEQLQLG
jgi:predicted N-acetyltransferase YhbS